MLPCRLPHISLQHIFASFELLCQLQSPSRVLWWHQQDPWGEAWPRCCWSTVSSWRSTPSWPIWKRSLWTVLLPAAGHKWGIELTMEQECELFVNYTSKNWHPPCFTAYQSILDLSECEGHLCTCSGTRDCSLICWILWNQGQATAASGLNLDFWCQDIMYYPAG